MPEKKPSPIEVVQNYNEQIAASLRTPPALLFVSAMHSCETALEGKVCLIKRHCVHCGKHYKLMAYNYPKPCSIICEKVVNNDPWPSRSTMVRK